MHNDVQTDEAPLVKNRVMDIIVALVLLAGSGIVIYDAQRMGYGWVEGEGPAAGYFPFYIAIALGLASLITLVKAVLGKVADGDEVFVSKPAMLRVLTVLLPAIAFVGLIQFLGIYVASVIFIAGFMIAVGGNPVIKSVLVGLGVPLVLFFMFEKWFMVPLPKGPLEALWGL